MWLLIALAVVGGEVKQATPLAEFGSREQCIVYSVGYGYDHPVYETSNSIILDDGKIDGWAMMCWTDEKKA